ncbi:hypothetical protein L1049_007181 [Liquidambar formosana]|uniref:Uncharacterized protein n=1 Tax=Liquidambar formosana TaxID=63359 RepID=A0AAP0RGT0_LIQFO
MEDWNTLAADCVVISCCCQCLILQVVVFILLKLPYKLIRKTKEYAKKKLRHRKREEKMIETVERRFKDEFLGIHGGSVRFKVDGSPINMEGHGCGKCMEEAEKVLEELCQQGEFAFGSFWGREESESFQTYVAKQEFESNVVEYHLIEMIDSFSYP